MSVMVQPLTNAQQEFRGTIFVLFSGIFYGTMGYFGIQLFAEHFTLFALLFWRFFIASLWIFFTAKIFYRFSFTSNVSKQVWLQNILLGIVTYTCSSMFYFLATRYVGTGIAMVIFFCYPIWVAAISWILGTASINKYTLAALTAVSIGLFLINGQLNAIHNIWGIIFAILAAICFAIYLYGSRQSNAVLAVSLSSFWICLGNAVIFLVVSISTDQFVIPQSLSSWGYVLAFGIIATALPIQFLLEGLKFISPIKAAIISVFEPVVTLLLGLCLLHEKISFTQSIGILIILTSAIFIQFEKRHQLIKE